MCKSHFHLRLVFFAVLLVACKTGSPNTAIGAAVTTAAGLSASVANRAAGGCYAICTAGTVCNPRTGLCDREACDGKCGAGEICEETFTGSKCVAGTTGVVTKADRSDSAMMTFGRLGPRITRMAISSTSAGIACTMSTTRWIR